ncbi:hypothetical protein DY000_02031505 [Brassica cretica]|uniref:Uncharacterized protein n=1 Tax=Brassica cretica TaxID=69181 RepID=A0ABQ7DXG8_BRACR|nr:hypothetical protein DY000_02031505 [Brassica cretica]
MGIGLTLLIVCKWLIAGQVMVDEFGYAERVWGMDWSDGGFGYRSDQDDGNGISEMFGHDRSPLQRTRSFPIYGNMTRTVQHSGGHTKFSQGVRPNFNKGPRSNKGKGRGFGGQANNRGNTGVCYTCDQPRHILSQLGADLEMSGLVPFDQWHVVHFFDLRLFGVMSWRTPASGSSLGGTPGPRYEVFRVRSQGPSPSPGKRKTSDMENLPYLRIWKSLTYSNRLRPALRRLYNGNLNPKARDQHFET